MSIFSEEKIKVCPNEPITYMAVSHQLLNNVVAVTTKKNILFYNENADKCEFELSRNISPIIIEWHPTQPILAIGWETGLISLWSENTKMAKEEPNFHKAEILCIQFNPDGSKMVTSDKQGKVGVWRGINCISQYNREQSITHITFANLQLEQAKLNQCLFFMGGESGIICLADDQSHCSEVCKVGGPISQLLFYQKQNSVIIITKSLLLVQFRISATEKSAPDKKVKLSVAGDQQSLESLWIGDCLLATSSSENMLRLWHIESDENYVLTLFEFAEHLQQFQQKNVINDKIITIKYDTLGRVLLGGTKEGRILFWKSLCFGTQSPNDSDQWKPYPFLQIFNHQVEQICIGKNNGFIATRSGTNLSLIRETPIQTCMNGIIKVLQVSSRIIQIYISKKQGEEDKTLKFLFESKNNINGVDCTETHLLIWGGKKIEIHEIIQVGNEPSLKMIGVFQEDCILVKLYKDKDVLIQQEYTINICNDKGIIKQSLVFSQSEGSICEFSLRKNFLVAFSKNNYIKLYDLSRREARIILTRKFEDSSGSLGIIRQVRVNEDGSLIGVVCDIIDVSSSKSASKSFYIYDVEIDSFNRYSIQELDNNFQDFIPFSIFWDMNDRRFFAVYFEGKQRRQGVFTFYYSFEIGIKLQDKYTIEKSENIEGVFSLSAPYLLLIQRTQQKFPYSILEKVLKDFQGIQQLDDQNKKAIMNFSFYLASGNLDEAYKSVKAIQNPLIWENMAQMCVKTGRLDVAEICIGNMRFGRGAKAIRQAKQNEKEIESHLAMVAIQLNMKEEAKKLYEKCKRYDLINKMHMSNGQWEESIKIAEGHDRINLKNTYYKAARQMEISRDFQKAIELYEKSETYQKEVPRMLLMANEIDFLKEYILKKKEPKLFVWYAQYLESIGEIEDALQYYLQGQEYSSCVRLLILQQDLKRAKQICIEFGDPAACYYFALEMERQQNFNEAIIFHTKAQFFGQAVKLACQKGLDVEAFQAALQAPPLIQRQTAFYFKIKGQFEKALNLYTRGGDLKEALDLCIKTKLFDDYLPKIMKQVSKNTDSETMGRLSQLFLDNGQFKQAIQILISIKQIDKALDIFLNQNIQITEDQVESMIPDKNHPERKEIVRQIGEKAYKQGSYQVASSLFMELGEKVKAAKCLIKLNNIDQVISFALNARSSEIYILAANFLQTVDWHQNPTVAKHIINFYTKAKSFIHIVTFYEACSQFEVIQYGDYNKALQALQNAAKASQKCNVQERDKKIEQLQQKIRIIEQFLSAKKLSKSDKNQFLKEIQLLLGQENIENIIRIGDIYSALTEFYTSQQEFNTAYNVLQKMQAKKLNVQKFIDPDILQLILQKVGKSSNEFINIQEDKKREKDDIEEEFEENQ